MVVKCALRNNSLNQDRAASAKPPTARAAIALAKSQAYQDAADAPATLKAYATDLANYTAWCAANALTAMPASPQVVGAYLAAAGEGYAAPTLRRRVRGNRPRLRSRRPSAGHQTPGNPRDAERHRAQARQPAATLGRSHHGGVAKNSAGSAARIWRARATAPCSCWPMPERCGDRNSSHWTSRMSAGRMTG